MGYRGWCYKKRNGDYIDIKEDIFNNLEKIFTVIYIIEAIGTITSFFKYNNTINYEMLIIILIISNTIFIHFGLKQKKEIYLFTRNELSRVLYDPDIYLTDYETIYEILNDTECKVHITYKIKQIGQEEIDKIKMCVGIQNMEFEDLKLNINKGSIERVNYLDRERNGVKYYFYNYIPEHPIDKKEYSFTLTHNYLGFRKNEKHTIMIGIMFKTKHSKFIIRVPINAKITSYNGIIKGKESKIKIKNKLFEKSSDDREVKLKLENPKLLQNYLFFFKWDTNGKT